MTEWQPIETAIDDEVLSWNGKGFYLVIKSWNGQWFSCCDKLYPLEPQPTHWMPLPEPPKEGE